MSGIPRDGEGAVPWCAAREVVRETEALNPRNPVACLRTYPNSDRVLVGRTDAVGTDSHSRARSLRVFSCFWIIE